MKIELDKNTTTINNNRILEKTRLNNAFLNYNNIIEKNLPYKFAYLDEWLLKQSKLLLNEIGTEKTTFKTFKRGTIIKVDFGVGLHSEMSQVHFAIVLNNYDNPRNSILTVLPLTSKKNKYNLDLGHLVFEKMEIQIKKQIVDIGKNEELEPMEQTQEKAIKIKKLNTLLSYYKSNRKNTYACCSLITTISKTKILKPINELDIIGKTRCSRSIMETIDKELLKIFTKI